MSVSAYRLTQALRQLEGRLWTGPFAHLLGGGLDVLEALARASRRRIGRADRV